MEPNCAGTNTAANDMNMVLYLSAEEAAIVTVTIDSSGTAFVPAWTKTYVIPAYTVISTENLPKGSQDAAASNSDPNYDARLFDNAPPLGSGGELLWRKKGIHIVSNVPIVAYAHIYGGVSSGATMLMPVNTWGYSYTSVNSEQRDADRSYSWMYVVAKENNTLVEITPSATSRKGKPAGVPFQVLIQKGQIYQLVGQADCATGNGPELTGTTVKSLVGPDGKCHPVAVFGGSSRTGGETLTCGTGSGRDNDMQQLFPEHAWGKRYATAPFSKSSGAILQPTSFQTSVYKVVVKDPTTIVRRNGVQLTGLIANKYYKFSSVTADYIVADKPVMVAQFMSGTGACNGGSGDPEMLILSPVEQAIKQVGFYRNTKEAINANYLTLVVPTAGVPSLRIDNSSVFNHTYPHPNLPGYTVVVKGWVSAQTQALVKCDSGFTAITYGLGGAESYGYNAGTYINNLSAIGAIHNTFDTSNTTNSFTCTRTPVELSVLMTYKPLKMEWLLSTLSSVITPNTDVIFNSPVVIDSPFVNGIKYYKYTIPGNYSFSDTGTFSVPIVVTSPTIDNCTSSDTVFYTITVKGKPVANFTFTHSGCRLDTVLFSGPAGTANGFNIRYWNWTFPGGGVDSIQNPRKLISSIGIQNIALQVISAEGCVGDTIKPIAIFQKPLTNFGTTPAAICEGGTISFTDTSFFGGSAPVNSWYWDFGGVNKITAANGNAQVVSFPAYGSYPVKHTVSVSNTCPADTVTKTILVYAAPRASFTYPAGCLPANGIVQFTSTATVPDGQAITGHSWNFGDPNASVANPNTSTAASPTHTYATFGSYTITYRATTANGCTKDTTVVATFNLSPTFAYPPVPAVCESVTGTVSVATASVTNAVPGTGLYRGTATTPAGLFSPSQAGAGTHKIWYVFSATSGCTDSVSIDMVVYPKPAANFNIPSASCLPASGIVQFNYTGSLSLGQTYAWNFGDPASGALNTSGLVNPVHNYVTGPFTINLRVTTTQGCFDDTAFNAVFTVSPALNYPPLAPVCESITGTISIATATVTNGVTGTGIYKGPGTTPAGIFSPSLAGAGTHTILYIFTTPGNCIDTILNTIRVNPKPLASFTYPTVCLPVSGSAQFTYNGTTASVYTWNFGDPASGTLNTSLLQSPTHIYTNTGSYGIALSVTDANGCVDDTLITTVLSVTPALNYPALAPVCESVPGTISVATATVTNGVTGTGVYSGPGTTAAGIFSPTISGPGTHTIVYSFTSTGNCVSTISSSITVGTRPLASFTYAPTTCLPITGQVQFTFNGSTTAGQTYLWNFNDPDANTGNPNISTALNPTHNYSNTGTYNILLTVTGANGCADDTTITRTFSVTPALSYPALAPICESVTGTVSIATATVTNGVSGTGVYSGPGTTANGTFNPSVAGAGTHTILYTFTSTGNCVSVITNDITVGPKPSASFTYSPTTCLPVTGQVQFTFNGSATAGQAYLWNFNDPNATAGNPNTSTAQNPTHNYSNTGTYNILLSLTGGNGCTDDTTITRTFSVTPELNYPALAPICESVAGTVSVATATVLNGVTGTGVYSGPGTDAAGIFNPAVAGPGTHTIVYTFTSTANCVNTISRTITVGSKPLASFTYSPTTCLPTNGQVQFTFNGSATAGQTYSWNFNDPNATALNPNTSTAINPTHNYSNTGTYNILLTVTGANGCTDDTTLIRTFSVTPALNYPALPSVCESITTPISVATATVTNGVTGTGVYSGPGTDAAGNFSPSLAGPGSHTIIYTFTSTGNCVVTVSGIITIRPKPLASFTYLPAGCLPTTGQVQFTFNGSSTAGQTYLWNFNDPNASVANPNTSTAINPTHNYSNSGTYNILLTVTGANGCTDDTTITKTFSVTPALNYPALASVCESVSGTISVATATVTNGVTGTGVYSGPGTDAGGNFSPSLAGPGTHTIVYTFTAAGNCVVTISSAITIRPKPLASFTYLPAGCLPTTGQVQFSFNGSTTAGQTYLWNFNDPNAAGGNANTSTVLNPAHNFTNTGTYNILLTVTGANGCTDDTTITSIFSVKPALIYPPLAAVCESLPGTISIATATVTNGVTGAGVYSGAGTDAAGNFSPSVAGPGIHLVKYIFTSTGRCIDSISRNITVYPKPSAAFAITSNICFNQLATINNQSTIGAGAISTWQWNFGDGNTVAYPNGNQFTRAYNSFGNYTVSLVSVSDNGCVSDTAKNVIGVHSLPVTNFSMPASVCMPNGAVVFTNLSTNPDNASMTYRWDFGDAGAPSFAVNPSHTYAIAQSYPITLRATSSFGCFKDTVKSFSAFFDKPVADFSVTPDTVCQGTAHVFTDRSTAPNSTIQSRNWDFGDGTNSSGTNPSKTYTIPGNYGVQLTVINAVGCRSDAFTDTVVVNLQPKVDAGPSFIVPFNTVIMFNPAVNDSSVVQYLWTRASDFADPTILRPVITALYNQTYTLTATGPGNCTASDILEVKILKPIIVPNAFSPNGDGTNDTWIINDLADYPGATVDVYNRYGQVVYSSSGYPVPWNGTTNGKPLPFATYYYIINLKNGFQALSGSITIVK
ncbi:MAG: PKD domain-containing protein [Ferruginibacter sp.]|nr:PKD domain-containing protein [Ferruginibacter sp.]